MPEKQLVPFWRFSIIAISTASHSLATDHWPLFSSHWPRFSRPAPAPHAAGRELGLFSCSIPPSSVLSSYPKTLSSPGFYGGYTPFSDSY